jgi:iron complex transport system ATP-binding protein
MLKIDSLSVTYDQCCALDDVSLEVGAGEILAVIGPNGAGKSTLIRAASGILHVQNGQVSFGGQDITYLDEKQRARLISVVPQATSLGGAFTVQQTVELGRTAFMSWLGSVGEEDKQKVARALEQTDLTAFSERRVAELSGGEQQRVFVARALAQDTPIMLLDEPTNHLDLQHQTRLLNLVKSLARNHQLAVLMALHDLNMVSLYADKVALLVGGRLVAYGTPAEVLTEQNINQAYQAAVDVFVYPRDGRTLILPMAS